ncbi:MAG: DUF58 domain-containing protein [Planctomycetaceae bacterium]|jgi:uncharacterized protein (DUF58 family)|nr:DUF58 domain-containing protein [Planctomycetaceae bacterium]
MSNPTEFPNRHKTSLTREGMLFLIIVVVTFLGAAIREVNLMLLMAALLLCVFVIAWRLGCRTIAGIDATRIFSSRCYAGEIFVVAVELENRRETLPAWAIVVEDSLQFVDVTNNTSPKISDKHSLRPAVYFEFVPANSKRRKTYAGILPRRGRYRLGRMTISTKFPCGFLRLRREVGDSGKSVTLTVLPRIGKISSRLLVRAYAANEARKHARFRSSRIGGEFLGLRRWQSGDSVRWIHWRASAKHRKIVVRKFEQQRTHDATVILDLFQTVEPHMRQLECIELAVSFTATLLTELTRLGVANLSLVFYNLFEQEIEVLNGAPNTILLEQMLEKLAVIEPTTNDTLPALFNALLMRRSAQSGEIFMVTAKPLEVTSTERLNELKEDSRFRQLLGRVRVIDTSANDLGEVFSCE